MSNMSAEYPPSEKAGWDSIAQMLGNYQFSFGLSSTYQFRSSPSEFVSLLSFYKFSMRVACKKGDVLELGCGDGIGATMLAENMNHYLGVDLDERAIESVKGNLPETTYGEKYRFIAENFIGKKYGGFDVVVDSHGICMKTVAENVADEGLCVVRGKNLRELKSWFHQAFFFRMEKGIVVACSLLESPCFAIGVHKRNS